MLLPVTPWQLYNKRPTHLSLYQKWAQGVRLGKPVFGAFIRGRWYVAVPRSRNKDVELVEVPFQRKSTTEIINESRRITASTTGPVQSGS